MDEDELELERQKLQWEREKLIKSHELELEKLKKENGLNFKNTIPGISIIVSALIVIVTLWVNEQNQIDQNKADRELARMTASFDFQLKAAEIVMNSDNPGEARSKAIALKRFFKNMLPEDFGDNFNTTDLGGPNKAKIIDLLAEYPNNRAQILRDWALLWPNDEYLIQTLALNTADMS